MSTAVINPAKLDSVLNTCTEESMMIITRLAQNLPECARRDFHLHLCHYCSAHAIGAVHFFHIPTNGDRQVPAAVTEAAKQIDRIAGKRELKNTPEMKILYARIIAALACYPLFGAA